MSWVVNPLAISGEGFEDLVGSLGPDERPGSISACPARPAFVQRPGDDKPGLLIGDLACLAPRPALGPGYLRPADRDFRVL